MSSPVYSTTKFYSRTDSQARKVFRVRQIDLNETKLHVSGGIIVAVSIVSRTDDINASVCHASVQIVDVLQFGTMGVKKSEVKQSKLLTGLNHTDLPNGSFAIAPQRYGDASIKIRC